MIEYTIRYMMPHELTSFYKQLLQDFPPSEYTPYNILRRQCREGLQEGLVLMKDNQAIGYAICAASLDHVLISFLAIYPEYRARGAGSAFLQALVNHYSEKQAIIAEVERPELASNPIDITFREARISFYEKAGFALIKGIDYVIWDVPMHLMAYPVVSNIDSISENIGEIMYQIYLQLMGEEYMDKMIINKTPQLLNLRQEECNECD